MKNKTRTVRILLTALLTAAFVVSGLWTVATATNLPFERSLLPGVVTSGIVVTALCALAATSTLGMIVAAALFAAVAGIWALANRGALGMVREFFALWQGGQGDLARAAQGGGAFFVCAAAVLAGVFYMLLYRRELTALAVMLLAAVLVCAHAMSDSASIAATVPGLIAGAAAFALTGGAQRDASAARVLIPSALAVLLALLLLPGGRVTWKPLEEAGNRVRGIFEQYFSFTHERIAFSISEEGYNHGGEIDGQTVAMLGGPAQPDEEPVMRVTSDGNVLLRGTIRATYTGYSWIDVIPKSRYLYYDLTHRSVRDRVFDQASDNAGGAFTERVAEVEVLSEGTSTLFVPGRLRRFSMDLSNAVYYNSAGEMFMAREAQPGDKYGLKGLEPAYGEALRQAVIRGEGSDDGRYAEIAAAHAELPRGIEDGLYALTVDITRDAQNPYDRATAIAEYLRRNMRYRLEVAYPPVGRDFVSWFVLESKEGYCSYYASAMAVMGRIAGLPTRYVEGYYARPNAEGIAVLTGRDAHAWAEVYFRGVGWVPFDATGGTTARNGGEQGAEGSAWNPEDSAYGKPMGDTWDMPDTTAPTVPDATPLPEDGQTNGLDDEPQPTPTPEPEGDAPEDEPEDEPEDDFMPDEDPGPRDESETNPERRGGLWIVWMLLLLLILVALCVYWVRSRLMGSDPERLCGSVRRGQQAAMIAYRANLTLLSQMGQGPVNGETPEVFARRVADQFDNPDFECFTQAVTLNRYGNRPIRRGDIDAGLRAYRIFKRSMSRLERLRFGLTRVFRGLGDFETIP